MAVIVPSCLLIFVWLVAPRGVAGLPVCPAFRRAGSGRAWSAVRMVVSASLGWGVEGVEQLLPVVGPGPVGGKVQREPAAGAGQPAGTSPIASVNDDRRHVDSTQRHLVLCQTTEIPLFAVGQI